MCEQESKAEKPKNNNPSASLDFIRRRPQVFGLCEPCGEEKEPPAEKPKGNTTAFIQWHREVCYKAGIYPGSETEESHHSLSPKIESAK